MKNIKLITYSLISLFIFPISNSIQTHLLDRQINDVINTIECLANQKASGIVNITIADNLIEGTSNYRYNKQEETKSLNTTGIIVDNASSIDTTKGIDAFKNKGRSGNARCAYFEETMSGQTKEGKIFSTLAKYWFMGDGRGRSEMNMAALIAAAAGYKLDSKPIVALTRANLPDYIVTLDDEEKTYSYESIGQNKMRNDKPFNVQLVGNETVNGYSCKHVRLKRHKETIDLWLSTEVPGFEDYRKAFTIAGAGAQSDYYSSLRAAGYEGFPVKESIDKSKVTIILTKASYVSVKNSFFDIPSGYSETKKSNIINNLWKSAVGAQEGE
jgi:hypothetical protein